MKETLGTILVILIWVSGFADYGLGVFHSFDKHGVIDGYVGTALFPWAMYRGIEFWWHDDYAGVNWDQRLKTDMKSCVYFFEESNKDANNKYQLNEDLEKFSTKIRSYPKDKKQYLKNGCKIIISYDLSLTQD